LINFGKAASKRWPFQFQGIPLVILINAIQSSDNKFFSSFFAILMRTLPGFAFARNNKKPSIPKS
jgi:hypothetical protein